MTGKITDLSAIGSIDRAADLLEVVDISAGSSNKVTPNNLLGITGNPVGTTDSQTLTNKMLTAPTISSPVLSGTLTGTYTIGGTPTFPSSVATLTGSQTLTNKVLTSPTINTPTITNASITADSISGFSTANTGTIYGVAITSGALGANTVTTTSITNASVTPSKLATGAAYATVATPEATTSTSYTALATAGPSATVTIGANGLALVTVTSLHYNGTAGNDVFHSFAISGATTVAATDTRASTSNGTAGVTCSNTTLVTGLVAGSTTFTSQYRTSAGTANYLNRSISVVPL